MIESYTITDVLKHIDPNTNPKDHLIVFDIDNTLVESIDQLASTQWFDTMVKMTMERDGISKLEALEKTLPLNFVLIKHSIIRPIEPTTVSVIKELQENAYNVIALTARSPEPLKECTIEHLSRVDINFSRTSIYPNEIVFNPRMHYSNGIIFSGGDPHKGDSLFSVINHIAYTPKKIIFVDDKEHNHRAIQDTFKQTNIDHTCIWYRYCDEKAEQFDLTFTHGRLLSLCEQYPEIDALYQAWLQPKKCL
jgi:hypothetical protein